MKKVLISITALIILFSSCRKETAGGNNKFSSYTVTNAAVNISNAKVYAADRLITWKTLPATDAVAFGRSFIFAAYAGNNYVRAVSAADTTISIFSSTKAEEFKEDGFNTLFLCGNTGTYEGIFLQNDNIPNQVDNTIGIRIINLSPNSTPLNVTLAATPTVNEASNIAYKQKTDFKIYSADPSVAQYDFQVRDAATNALLSTYSLKQTATTSPYTTISLALARKKNITLVIKGLQGTTSGTNAFGIFPMAHY